MFFLLDKDNEPDETDVHLLPERYSERLFRSEASRMLELMRAGHFGEGSGIRKRQVSRTTD